MYILNNSPRELPRCTTLTDSTMEGTPRTTSLTFYSGGKDNPREDRRMEAKLDTLEKDHAKLQENVLSLTQRVDFLRNEFKELKSSGNELINNKITLLENVLRNLIVF